MMETQSEPHVVINGVTLDKSQTMLLFCAVKEFSLTLRNNELTEEGTGNVQNAAWLLRLYQLESLFSRHPSQER